MARRGRWSWTMSSCGGRRNDEQRAPVRRRRIGGCVRALAVLAICAYQRHVSPYKGFCCAYREHTGRDSCSTLGLRAIRRYGLWRGLSILQRRMYLCGVAHRRHQRLYLFLSPSGPMSLFPSIRPPAGQRGDCDIGGCDALPDASCDLPGGKGLSRLCNAASCCDAGSCDWRNNDTPRRWARDRRAHIPPKRSPPTAWPMAIPDSANAGISGPTR